MSLANISVLSLVTTNNPKIVLFEEIVILLVRKWHETLPRYLLLGRNV